MDVTSLDAYLVNNVNKTTKCKQDYCTTSFETFIKALACFANF